MFDMVNSPIHYSAGGVECIDALQASMTRDEFLGYLKGNIMKYVWRYRDKGGVEDLKKANWYLNKLIDRWSMPTDPGPSDEEYNHIRSQVDGLF